MKILLKQFKRNKKLYIFSISILILFFFFIIGYIKDYDGNQAEIFAGKTNNYMADFYNIAKYSSDRDPYDNEIYGKKEKPYLPLTYTFMYFNSKMADYNNQSSFDAGKSTFGLISSSVIMLIWSLILLIQVYSNIKGSNAEKFLVMIVVLLSGVFLFSFERGNTVLLAAGLTMFYIFNYKNKNKFIRELSFISLAFAAGLKVFPAIFGLLLVFDKRYKEAVRLAIYGAMVCLLPFLFLQGGFSNISKMIANASENNFSYLTFKFYKYGLMYYIQYLNPATLYKIIPYFRIIKYVILVYSLFISYFEKDEFKKIAFISIILIFLPDYAGQYYGLYLIAPLVLYINTNNKYKLDSLFIISFILLFNPFQLFIFKSNMTFPLANGMLIVLFLVLLCEGTVNMVNYFKKRKTIKAVRLFHK